MGYKISIVLVILITVSPVSVNAQTGISSEGENKREPNWGTLHDPDSGYHRVGENGEGIVDLTGRHHLGSGIPCGPNDRLTNPEHCLPNSTTTRTNPANTNDTTAHTDILPTDALNTCPQPPPPTVNIWPPEWGLTGYPTTIWITPTPPITTTTTLHTTPITCTQTPTNYTIHIADPTAATFNHPTTYTASHPGNQHNPIAHHTFETKGGPYPITVTTTWTQTTTTQPTTAPNTQTATATTTIPYTINELIITPTTPN